MADDAGVAAHDDEVAKLRRAGNARLRDDDAVAPDDGVVADLNEVVDLRAFADDRIVEGAAIDGRVGADLDVVADDDAAHLRHLQMPLGAHRKPEAVLPDADARMQDDALADDGVRDGGAGADIAVAPDRHAIAHDGARSDGRAAADVGLPANDGAGLDRHALLDLRRDVDEPRGAIGFVGPGGDRPERIAIEEPQGGGEGAIGRLGLEGRGARRHAPTNDGATRQAPARVLLS